MNVKETFCQACLSNERSLYPTERLHALLQHLNLWELYQIKGSICCVCRSIILKFVKFKEQIRQAQDLLCNYEKLQNIDCLTPLNKLSIHTNTVIKHYIYDEQTITDKYKEFETDFIKIEINNTDYSDTNLGDCDESNELFKTKIDTIKTEVKDKKRKYSSKGTKVKRKNKLRINEVKDKLDETEINEKITTVVFTEAEMIRNREEKRNHPNFKKIPFKCDTCVLGFTKKEKQEEHMEKKHDEGIGDYNCNVCHIRFSNTKSVDRHKKKHYTCYRCKLCKYETIELWSAVNHCKVKHRLDSSDMIHCKECDTVAKTPEELMEHTRTNHMLYCSECGEKFKGKNTLRTHISRIHAVKRDFRCDICTKTFLTKNRLESHMATHNSVIAKKLAYCTICKVQYKNIYVYRNHVKNNSNHSERAYQCVICKKKFASKIYWQRHHNFYHLKISPYKCEICNKLFISDWRLRNHNQTQHGFTRSRNHPCNVCGKKFYTLPTLRDHQLTHSEQRSFMCEDCGDTFKQRPALYTHIRLVHKGVKRK